MATLLKQSTSVDLPIGPFLDDTDGKTAESGLTITQPDIRLKKNGDAWAQKNAAQTLSHEEAGWYEVTLDATDTDTLGQLLVAVHEAGALPVWREFLVVPANVYDALVGGSDVLQVDVSQFGNAAGTFASGRPEVNTTHAAGTAWASGSITAGVFAADAITAAKLAADVGTEIANAVGAHLFETTGSPDWSVDELLRLVGAVLLSKVSGLPGAPVYRDLNDTKNRVSATTDGDGNRSAVTLDPS